MDPLLVGALVSFSIAVCIKAYDFGYNKAIKDMKKARTKRR